MSDQWSDTLTTYHLPSCPAPDKPCTCRMDEVIEGVAHLEAENDVLRNTVSLLKNENERMTKLAHDYIEAYEKLAFGEKPFTGGTTPAYFSAQNKEEQDDEAQAPAKARRPLAR